MKKFNFRSFAMGALVTTLIFGSTLSVAASSGAVSKILNYNNINVTMNGTSVNLKDANGNRVEPFIIDGTTYLPVRAVADALGLNVAWNGSTNTVQLSNGPTGTTNSGTTSTGTTNTETTSTTSNENGIAAGTVVLNKNGVKATYLSAVRKTMYDGEYYDEYEFKFENTSNKTWNVYSRDLTVDKIQFDYASVGTEIAPGNTSYETMTIYESSLQEYAHLNDYDVLRMRFTMYDESWGNDAYSDYFEL